MDAASHGPPEGLQASKRLSIEGQAHFPTLLDDGGPLLSFSQFLVLLTGAVGEGLAAGVEGPSQDLRANPAFQSEWQDLLASIALYGPARVVLPAHLAADVDIQPLLELELAEILVVDLTRDLRAQIAATYEQAFKRCRELEVHPASTPPISFESLESGGSDVDQRLEALWLAGEAEFYADRLEAQVAPLVSALRDVFGYYVDANQADLLDALQGYGDEVFPDAQPPEEIASLRTADLYRSMGLYVRDRALLEAASGIRDVGISYTPTQLRDFEESDRRLTSPPEDFTSFARLGIQHRQFDWTDFLGVHAFWRSFYELVNMLEVAKAATNPLFIPSSAQVGEVAADPDKTTATTRDMLRTFRLFLAETGRLPSPTTLRDAHALRRDPHLRSLQEVLRDWTEVASGTSHDVQLLDRARKDIASATKLLKQNEHLNRAGKLVTYISWPVSLYDALKGSALGLGLAPIGPAIELYSAQQLRKAGWVRFGTP